MADLSGTAATDTAQRLCDFAPGDKVIISDVIDHEHPATKRLLDLGFLPGTEVLVVRRAPLRDPVVFELRGNRMALRRAEASRVLVTSSSGGPSDIAAGVAGTAKTSGSAA